MPTKSQVLTTDPHKVLDLIDGWTTTVAALEQHAETYLGYVQRPGGSPWDGRTADAAKPKLLLVNGGKGVLSWDLWRPARNIVATKYGVSLL